jgi:nitrilase
MHAGSTATTGNTAPGTARMRIGLAQLDSGADVQSNLARIEKLIAEGAAWAADLVMLPEACTYRGAFREDAVEDMAGRTVGELRRMAAAAGVAVLVGGIWLRSGAPRRPYNASLFIDAGGHVLARYDKVHLFRLDDPPVTEDEANVTTPGERLRLLAWRGWKLGLSICYDLRFPELYRSLAHAGADMLCVPANFSAATGPPHWETLARARAIENLCYVAAPAQTGTAPDGFVAHGHSLLVDPWGAVEVDAGSATGLHLAELSRDHLTSRRSALNTPRETRPDVYDRGVAEGAEGTDDAG